MPNTEKVKKAWDFIVRSEQNQIMIDFQAGKVDSLGAFLDPNGIIHVGRRIQQTVLLIPKSQLVEFLIKDAHELGHGVVLHTASKVRTNVWVFHLLKLVK